MSTENKQMFAPRVDSAAIVRVFGLILRTKNDCWEWQGALVKKGYGVVYLSSERTNVFVHRLLYAWAVEPIPRGYTMTLDHLCRNRKCCNPVHLELVHCRENHLRGLQSGKTINPNTLANLVSTRNRNKTECKRGHPLSGNNLLVVSNGSRQCRACKAIYRERRRAGAGTGR